jgi:hypothetical protein
MKENPGLKRQGRPNHFYNILVSLEAPEHNFYNLDIPILLRMLEGHFLKEFGLIARVAIDDLELSRLAGALAKWVG